MSFLVHPRRMFVLRKRPRSRRRGVRLDFVPAVWLCALGTLANVMDAAEFRFAVKLAPGRWSCSRSSSGSGSRSTGMAMMGRGGSPV
jgi:hypothetical protein